MMSRDVAGAHWVISGFSLAPRLMWKEIGITTKLDDMAADSAAYPASTISGRSDDLGRLTLGEGYL